MSEQKVSIAPGTLAAVTFDDWFFAADGQNYRVAFGPVTIIDAKEVLGLAPKNSANWYAQVGFGDGAVLLAGCRIHSAIITRTKPSGVHVYDAS